MNILKSIKEAFLFNLFPNIFKRRRHIRDYFSLAKNGTIVGAADNDPAGIVTYSQAGASLGFALLWLMLLTTPLLIAIEDMSARIGVVAKKSLPMLIKSKYGFRWILFIAAIVAIANIITIGADIAGMGEVLAFMTGGPSTFFSLLITLFIASLLIRSSYSVISRYLFLLTPVFLAYIATAFFAKTDWHQVFIHTINPLLGGGKDYWLIAVAILGTTLSPYLIFWQNTEEIEEGKTIKDLANEDLGVKAGMIYCNLISYFIIVTTAAVLFRHGITLNTSKEAAEALKPLAGNRAYLLFSFGVLGSGFLAIPILASSTAYVFSDAFHWREGLDKKIMQARGFYAVLLLSLFIGLMTIFLGLNPIKMMVYSQVLDGLAMPLLIYFLLKIANDKKILGRYTNKLWVNFFGGLCFLIILVFDLILIWQWFK